MRKACSQVLTRELDRNRAAHYQHGPDYPSMRVADHTMWMGTIPPGGRPDPA